MSGGVTVCVAKVGFVFEMFKSGSGVDITAPIPVALSACTPKLDCAHPRPVREKNELVLTHHSLGHREAVSRVAVLLVGRRP